MVQVIVRFENIEDALRRLRRKVNQDGLFRELEFRASHNRKKMKISRAAKRRHRMERREAERR